MLFWKLTRLKLKLLWQISLGILQWALIWPFNE